MQDVQKEDNKKTAITVVPTDLSNRKRFSFLQHSSFYLKSQKKPVYLPDNRPTPQALSGSLYPRKQPLETGEEKPIFLAEKRGRHKGRLGGERGRLVKPRRSEDFHKSYLK